MDACGFLGGYVDDFITGRQLPDSDNEQIRQKLEKFLVQEKGFAPEAITVDHPFEIECENQNGDSHRRPGGNGFGKAFYADSMPPGVHRDPA